jgi:uncharacterized protein YfiM (DUF2279 family)
MNPLALILAMSLQPGPASTAKPLPVLAGTRPGDAWIAEDKLKHGFMSLAVVGFTQAGARTVGFDQSAAAVMGVAVGAIAGLGKEWYDRRHGRPFSYRDLIWDSIGIAAGAWVAGNIRE